MANQEHLDTLLQGVGVWNKWRKEHPDILPYLRYANLSGADLSLTNLSRADLRDVYFRGGNLNGADLRGVALCGARFNGVNLSGAILTDVDFRGTTLTAVDLSNAYLGGAILRGTDLSGVILRGAILSRADLSHAILSGVDLGYAILSEANLTSTDLQNANLVDSIIGQTYFVDNDLSTSKGLETVKHTRPSSIGVDTLYKSGGNVPDLFLRGCGLSDWEIESVKLYNPKLSNQEINDIHYRIHDLRVSLAFQINPLFISYSHADSHFVDAIETYLTAQGIRFWRDIHHAKAGRLEKQIDAAIHLNDVVLLVLSEHSTDSDWVEHEARKAREKEKKAGKDTLCPVALDDSWKTCRWPARLREQIEEYNILDFSNWQDAVAFQQQFAKLLEGLNLFYK